MEESVSIRGIYATALTHRLHESLSVVTPSPTIRDRFELSFPNGEPGVQVQSSPDRFGVELSGDPDDVTKAVTALESMARDGFGWRDPVGQGTVVDGVVTGSRGGGAIVDLGDSDGYLPFEAVDDYIEAGDRVRVQVQDPQPPWTERRHGVSPAVAVSGVLVSLVRGVDALVAATPRDGQDLGRTTDLLDVDLPAEWGVRWESPAVDCELSVLESALSTMADRATAVESALDAEDGTGDPPAVVWESGATHWVRFGRETRFRLDEDRDTVVSTMPGHHRIKAGGDTAGTAVDFAEGLDVDVESFPWAVVTEQFGPTEGDTVRIGHGKPDGRAYDLGPGEVTDRDPDAERIDVRRTLESAGTYDGLDVQKSAGDVAVTTFREGQWWYPTTYRSADGELRGTYLNVNTPIEVFPDAVEYVDLHVDVVKWPDGRVAVVDEAELSATVEAGDVSEDLAEKAMAVAESVRTAIDGE